MKVTHLQNVRQIFHEKTHISVMSLLRRIFFLKGFLEYEIWKKAVSVRQNVWTVVTYLPRLGPHSGHAEHHDDITCQQGLSEKWRPFHGKNNNL